MPTTRKPAKLKAQPELPDAFYRITSLLHTIRTIAQHEDRLCLLRNEIKRTQAIKPRLMKELKALLDELPADEYIADLHAIELDLSKTALAGKKPTKTTSKKTPAKHPKSSA